MTSQFNKHVGFPLTSTIKDDGIRDFTNDKDNAITYMYIHICIYIYIYIYLVGPGNVGRVSK